MIGAKDLLTPVQVRGHRRRRASLDIVANLGSTWEMRWTER